jgi:hypothetical protein
MEAAGQVQNLRAGTEQSFNSLLAKGCPKAWAEGPQERGSGAGGDAETAPISLGRASL